MDSELSWNILQEIFFSESPMTKQEISESLSVHGSSINSILYGNRPSTFQIVGTYPGTMRPLWDLSPSSREYMEGKFTEDSKSEAPKTHQPDYFCPDCGRILIGGKAGEHNFCPGCAGSDGKERIVLPHDFRPSGDASDPAEEHWVSFHGYRASPTMPERERLESLKRAMRVEILNREDCCPNFHKLSKIGPPMSEKRFNFIVRHLEFLLQYPAYGNDAIRKKDIENFRNWWNSQSGE